jgi:hypothetical protein
MKPAQNLLEFELKSSEDKNRTSNTNRNSTDTTNRIMGVTSRSLTQDSLAEMR